METTTTEYKSLYEMLDRFPYILANSVEKVLEYNEPLIEALSDENDQYYHSLTMKELVEDHGFKTDFKFDPEMNVGEACEFDEVLAEEIYSYIADADYPEIYQTFIVDEYGHEILKDYDQFTYYNEELDLYFWGVMHFGTAWSYVMGNKYPSKNKDRYEVRF